MAGAAFGIVRFTVVLIFVIEAAQIGPNEPGWRNIGRAAWGASTTAGIFAAIGGGLFWRRYKPPLTTSQGALVGLIAAACSYVGVAVFGAVVGFNQDGEALIAVVMSLVCGVGSAVVTGQIVIPALVLVGVGVSALQRARVIHVVATETAPSKSK